MKIDSTKIWDMAGDMRVCMLASWNGKQLLARPMTSNVRKSQHAIYFLDEVGSDKEKEILQYPTVNLGYQDKATNAYLSISAMPKSVMTDRSLRKYGLISIRRFLTLPKIRAFALLPLHPILRKSGKAPTNW